LNATWQPFPVDHARPATVREPAFCRVALPDYLAILLAMTSAAEHMPLADVKNRLSEVVDRIEREHGRIVITKHGRPAAVVISIEDLEGLEETLDILSNPALLRRIKRAEAEIAAGQDEVLTKEQLLDRVRRR
jgi:antitoxin YefM